MNIRLYARLVEIILGSGLPEFVVIQTLQELLDNLLKKSAPPRPAA